MIYIFFVLVASHFLCDFALQNDFVAKFKARTIDDQYNPIWYWVLTAHAAIHALPVLLFTKYADLAVFMFVTHWFIDFFKCEKKLTFNQDQFFHLLVVIIISVVYGVIR